MKHSVHYRAAVYTKISFPFYLQKNTVDLFQVKDSPEITKDHNSVFSVFSSQTPFVDSCPSAATIESTKAIVETHYVEPSLVLITKQKSVRHPLWNRFHNCIYGVKV